MNASSDPPPFPSRGALLGLDYGSKRFGVAVTTPDQTIASPLESCDRRTPDLDARTLRRFVEDYRAVGLVVGLPVHMSGDEGGKAREARAFGEWASEATGLPVRFWDERYSTATAEMYLFQSTLSEKQKKSRRDMLAAQVILQAYLNADDREREPGPVH